MERWPPEDMNRLVARLGSAVLFILLLIAAIALAGLVNPWFWLAVVAVCAYGVWVLVRALRR
jgi:hypothetical protein